MSTTTGTQPAGHPIVGFGVRANRVLNTLGEVPAWSMSPGELRSSLVDLVRVEARVQELFLRVLAAADRADVAAESAATSTGAWLAAATGSPVREAHADVRLARALDEGFAATRDALAAGWVDVAQARVVVAAVQGLPAAAVEADGSLVGRAEKHLLTLAEGTDSPDTADSDTNSKPGDGTGDLVNHDSGNASDRSDRGARNVDGAADEVTGPGAQRDAGPGRQPGLDAVKLKQVGRHLFHVLDPDAADVELGRRLEAEERAAARKTYLSMFDNGDGTHTGRFKISNLHAAILDKAIDVFTAPRQNNHKTGHGDSHGQSDGPDQGIQGDAADPVDQRVERARRSRPEVLGDGFCRLLERLPVNRLPKAGGMSATVVVLLDYDKLLSGLGTATLDTGQVISAAMARRMACGSGVIPVVYRHVLGGKPVALDVGRRRRLHDEYQRIACVVQDRGCATEHCARPPGRTETHHRNPWSNGGGTSVENGLMLCPFHHHTAHSPGYDMRVLPTGKVRFHQRT